MVHTVSESRRVMTREILTQVSATKCVLLTGGIGAAHRRDPVGGSAYGIPRYSIVLYTCGAGCPVMIPWLVATSYWIARVSDVKANSPMKQSLARTPIFRGIPKCSIGSTKILDGIESCDLAGTAL